ncbi:charged multivesicular body protein 7 [Bombyx mandarina]|uniref:Charged multivesicular body protein 7 n=1 Tax=Bombyx mandarina TaxID=7092 RepID=A0A6J2JP02_BOMMA|nr:charged multivesicular body protein 7 [Bombyx mandarina]
MMGLPDRGIPEDKLPQCWYDDVRMNALFAPFRLKTTNPESWDMKMKFWSDMLRQWCKHRKDPIVSPADARAAFQRKGRTPACLDIVIEEMFRSGELCPISKYQRILHNGTEGWVRWTARLALKPAALALTAVSSFLPARQTLDNDGLPKASIECTQRFLLEGSVKELATELLHTNVPEIDRIGTIEELMKNFEYQGGREVFEVLLGWLVAQGYAVKKDEVIKLAEPDKKATPVTESDEALVKLVTAERHLHADSTRLSRELATIENDARAALQLGNRIAAKNHLRRKHKVQRKLEQCTKALENVQNLLQQMRDVHFNASIVDTYKTTSEAMKRGLKDNGLEVDTVHDTMDDLKEVMDSYSEMERALGTTIDDTDAAELERELKELLSGPSAPGGGTPGKEGEVGATQKPVRKTSEREFIFDGEERMLAELNDLGIEEASPSGKAEKDKENRVRRKIAVPDGDWEEKEKEPANDLDSAKQSKPWYPRFEECLKTDAAWRDADAAHEIRTDDRLHPGQKLDVDYTKPPRLYNSDFAVKDHRLEAGVWLYNRRDADDFACSTEFFSSESPGKAAVGGFQMAPGGERKKSQLSPDEETPDEELERRLKNLRGFN